MAEVLDPFEKETEKETESSKPAPKLQVQESAESGLVDLTTLLEEEEVSGSPIDWVTEQPKAKKVRVRLDKGIAG